ncbi:SLC13 family permease [bacterium]|nr:SLC13 family permease [bacterium]
MTTEQMIVFGIIGLAIILFIWDKWRYDIVALLALFLSVVTGVVPVKEAFSGFSDPVVVTVAAILVISAAISRSGFIDYALSLLSRFAEKPSLQITVLVLMVMVLSAFMNNVGALAVFLPIAISFARKVDRKPSELLMPLSFGSLLGGLVTLIGTPPNLLISRIRAEMVGAPYHMFDFAPVGLGICALSLIYLSFGWRLLPKDRRGKPSAEDQFAIQDYVSELAVPEKAAIIGQTVQEAEAMVEEEVSIVGLIRNSYKRLVPSFRMKIAEGDVLLVEGDTVALKGFMDKSGTELVGSEETETLSVTSDEVGIAEAVIREDSELIGMNAKRARLRSRFGVNLLAMRQAGTSLKHRLNEVRFRKGDVLVLQGNLDAMPETLSELGCLPLAERSLQLGRQRQTFMPVAILAAAVALTIMNVVPISIAFLGGVLLIALLRIMRPNEMYAAIDGPVLILLGAMIPVTAALQSTGGTEIIAGAIAAITGGLSAPMMLTVILVASMLITPFLNNAATVLLMAPIAVTLAHKLGLQPDPFLMAVALGTSCDFLTPIGHQSNTLVMGPGGYKFNDYWRLGLPLSILVVLAGVPLIMHFWPLR